MLRTNCVHRNILSPPTSSTDHRKITESRLRAVRPSAGFEHATPIQIYVCTTTRCPLPTLQNAARYTDRYSHVAQNVSRCTPKTKKYSGNKTPRRGRCAHIHYTYYTAARVRVFIQIGRVFPNRRTILKIRWKKKTRVGVLVLYNNTWAPTTI